MNREAIENKIKSLIKEFSLVSIDKNEIDLSKDILQEYSIDSIALINIIVDLEAEYRIEFEDSFFYDIENQLQGNVFVDIVFDMITGSKNDSK